MPEWVCEWCGSSFDPDNPSRDPSYCSRDCYLADRRADYRTVECTNCGTEIERPRWHVEQNDSNHFCNRECMGEWQSRQTGPDSPAWKGGYEDITRRPDNGRWRQVRREVLERDGKRCVACGLSNANHNRIIDQGIDVHHADKDGAKYDPANLLAVCRFCHPAFD